VRYRLRHRTSYRYAAPAFESFNEVRLQPVAGDSQTLLDFDLSIEPPATVISFRDYYGNAVHDFGVAYLHDRLVIESTSDVVTHAGSDEPLAGPAEGEPDASPALTELTSDVALEDDLAEFLGPSSLCPLEAETAEIAAALVAEEPETSALAFLRRAADHVRDRLEYVVGTTTVESSVAEVLAGGSGVCQDFAHVLISLCRHAGLPARYVSGYLWAAPEDGGDDSVEVETHAWLEALLPSENGRGEPMWVAADPTNRQLAGERHVKIGHGRHYADVPPIRGVYQGRAASKLDASVHMTRLNPQASARA